jgi:ABC-type dipeptide/oligopeptide/nickel transport system permease subunit
MTAARPAVQIDATPQRARSLWADAVVYIGRDRLTLGALLLLLIMSIACFLAPPIVENVLGVDPNRTRVPDRFLAPGEEGHILGTDQLGRDQLIRLLYGGRVSLAIAYSASILSLIIGVTLGLVAGYYGGRIDDAIIWLINTINSIPIIFLLLVASTLWSPSPEMLVIILALLGWIPSARLVRGEALSLREREYMIAARMLGAPTWRLLLYHFVPNILPTAIVYLTINAGTLILIESALSYLGVGVQPPAPSWGNMLTEAGSYFARGQHLIVPPGLCIAVTVLCFYLIGDGLRDALDPQTSRKR